MDNQAQQVYYWYAILECKILTKISLIVQKTIFFQNCFKIQREQLLSTTFFVKFDFQSTLFSKIVAMHSSLLHSVPNFGNVADMEEQLFDQCS